MPARNGRAVSKDEKGSNKVEVRRDKAVSASPVKEKRREDKERPFRVDPDDEAYIRDLQRPAVIKEDLTEMERRKRVQEILESKSFCTQLETIIRQEASDGTERDGEDDKAAMQRLSDLTLPPTTTSLHTLSGAPVPISDLRPSDKHTKQEVEVRNRLASLLRLIDLFHWSQGIYNHITLRFEDAVLVNPFGLLYHEISASNLIKTTTRGDIIDNGASMLGVNQTAFLVHSAILESRKDVECIIHLQSSIVTAVSSLKCGLMPICQEAMLIGPVGYHEFEELDDDEAERGSIVKNLGDKNVLVLRNNGIVTVGGSLQEAVLYAHHAVVVCETQIMMIRGGGGFVVVGRTIEQAAFLARNLIAACDHQIRAAKAGLENIYVPSERTLKRAQDIARAVASPRRVKEKNGNDNENDLSEGGLTPNGNSARSDSSGLGMTKSMSGQLECGIGELEWEAFMRVLDNAGLRTGHRYKQPQLKQKKASTARSTTRHSDIASPPVTSATGLVDESDAEAMRAHRMALLRKEQEKAKWLNSPNNYQKVEVFESGTDQPKVITKWVHDVFSQTANGTPVKISSAHQFSPCSSNPKEFKEKQREIKENRRLGGVSAGPQSQVLDGVTFEDLQLHRSDMETSQIPDNRTVIIGTASKGIIDREYQCNAQVYRQLYAANPFNHETDEDLKQYLHEVELKSPRNTPKITMTNEDSYTYTRSDSPFRMDSPCMDNVSLIQGAREYRRQQAAAMKSASLDDEEPLTDDKGDLSLRDDTMTSTEGGVGRMVYLDESYLSVSTSGARGRGSGFSRSKSERASGPRPLSQSTTVSARSGGFTSDEEPSKSEKKKKKSGLFSFMRRSKQDKKQKSAVAAS